jgi:hypothetical protein
MYTTQLPTVDMQHHAMYTTHVSTAAAKYQQLLWSNMLGMQIATSFALCIAFNLHEILFKHISCRSNAIHKVKEGAFKMKFFALV